MKQDLKFIDVFAQLPKGYRERALANYRAYTQKEGWADPENEKVIVSTQSPICEALHQGFVWGDTPEKYAFWQKVRNHYTKGTLLPSLPKPTTHTNPTT